MKLYQLKALVAYLQDARHITEIKRIADNVLAIQFDRDRMIAFDLSKGQSDIFWAKEVAPLRTYRAPFDRMLAKRLKGAHIQSIALLNHDKIIRITAMRQKSYKQDHTILQLELTGRHTNAILLDHQEIIIEALRHIDPTTSYRAVMPGLKLLPLPPYKGVRSEGSIDHVADWLRQRAQKRAINRLAQLKKRHAATLNKKIIRLRQILAQLPDPHALRGQAATLQKEATLILAHLHRIKPYDTILETVDFENHPITIDLPSLPNPHRIPEHLFAKSKRLEAKANRLHIEEENLKSRIIFYQRLLQNLQQTQEEQEIHLLFGATQPKKKHKARHEHCALFVIDEYRLLVGRNMRENQWILQHARADDWWFHLKDRPSAHCLLQGDRHRQIPQEIIEKAAHICVASSITQPGDYLVDYTRRRHVKVGKNAHVTYTHYRTIKIRKK